MLTLRQCITVEAGAGADSSELARKRSSTARHSQVGVESSVAGEGKNE